MIGATVYAQARAAIGRRLRNVFWRIPPDVLNNEPYGHNLRDVVSGPVYVEPNRALILRIPRTIERQWLAVHRSVTLQSPPWPWFATNVVVRRYQHVPAALLGAHYYCTGQYNHYHFLFDVVPILHAACTEPALAELPVIVPACIATTSAFAHFMDTNNIDPARILVLTQQLLRVEHLHIIHKGGLSVEKLHLLRECVGPPPVLNPTERIYVFRTDARRTLINRAEVMAYLKQRGFRPVCFEGMVFSEQLNIAASARQVVAEHGSGTANFLFHGEGQLGLLELFPASHRADDYRYMSKLLGYHYDCIRGEELDDVQTYSINIDILKGAVDRLLSD